ncbi:GumC family protein [Erythrobacter sp. GH1-10]|uniref:GumC family protein n=1 Tax=Erythrobacter sp. GH1-10 TaxID=3349334 RepID=UPI003877E6F7
MSQALTPTPQPSASLAPNLPIDPHGMMPANNAPVTLRDLIRIANRHKFMIIAIVSIVTLSVLAQQLLSPKIYRSTAHVQVELIDEVGLNQADIGSRNNQRVSNSVRLHRSRSSAERVLDDLNLLEDPAFLNELQDTSGTRAELRQRATNTLLSMIDVTTEPNSDLLQVTVSSQSPELSAKIANQLPESVGTVRNSIVNERRAELLEELQRELSERERTALEASKKVADFRKENRMLVGAGGIEDFSQLNRIAAASATASSARAGSAARASGVSAASSISSTAQASSPALEQLQRQRAQLLAEQSRMAPNFGPNHPDMVRVTSELSAVEANIDIERQQARAAAAEVNAANADRMVGLAQSEASRDAATAARLAGIASTLENRAFQNVANSVELNELVRTAELADEAFQSIAARVEQVQAQMQLEGVSSSMVSPAVPSFDAVSPTPIKTTLFALLASLTMGFMVAFTREFLDDRLRTAANISRYFNLPTFGMLPLMPKELSEDDPNDNPVIEDPHSLFAEVARSAYSDVRGLRETSGSQVVLVTSPLPGDGKSTVSVTLAAAGTAVGDKTLVLDLDLRKRGMVQQLQDTIDAPDLLDLIAGKIELDTLLPLTLNTLENGDVESEPLNAVNVLSASRKVDHPNSMIASRKLSELITALRERFDFIVINAPATLAVRDARALCDFADQTIMVARWGRTTSEQMRAALQLLSFRPKGVIFDHVDYAEHARRRYGDSVQFYVDSSDYYSSYYDPPTRFETLRERIARFFGKANRAA